MLTEVTQLANRTPGGGDGGDYGERLARLEERVDTLATREFVTAEIGSLKETFRTEHSKLQKDMHEIKTVANLVKWFLGALVTGAIGAGLKLLFDLLTQSG